MDRMTDSRSAVTYLIKIGKLKGRFDVLVKIIRRDGLNLPNEPSKSPPHTNNHPYYY